MQFDIKLMPYDEADRYRKTHERNAAFLHATKHKFRKALGLAVHNPELSHRNEILETTSIKEWDKAYRKLNKSTLTNFGDLNFIDIEISFITKDQIKAQPELYDIHLEHLANIYDDIVVWFKKEFDKTPLFSCIHGDEDIPHINMIFDTYRKNEKGKLYANKWTFFNLEHQIKKYPEFRGAKLNSRVKKELFLKIRHEFWVNFGKVKAAKEKADKKDKRDIENIN